MATLGLLGAVLLSGLVVRNAFADAFTVPPSAADLWDISQGATVTGNSPLGSGFDARDIFGGHVGTREPDQVVFADGQPAGFVHYVEWQTASPVTVGAFVVFADGDGPAVNNQREFAQFVLKAKSDPGSPDYDLVLYTQNVDSHPYVFVDPANYALIVTDITPATAQYFRAEFVQYDAGRGFDGPRIKELDGYPPAPSLTAQPGNRTVTAGSNITFTASAVGAQPLGYQWTFNGANIDGATDTSLTLTNLQPIQSGSYAVLVTNAFGSAQSSNAFLTVNPGPGSVIVRQSTNDLWDLSRGAVVTTNSSLQPGFDARDILGGHFSTTEPDQTVFQDGHPAGYVHYLEWRTPTPVTVGFFTLFTSGDGQAFNNQREFAQFVLKAKSSATSSNFDLTLYTYNVDSHPYAFVDPTNYAVIAASIGSVTAQYFRAEFVQYNAGANFNGPRIKELDAFPTGLSLADQPLGQAVIVGSNATFSVSAIGAPPLSYQWAFNGTNLAGATNAALTLTNVQFNQAGNYAAVVTNAAGRLVSSNALLTVVFPPAAVTVVSTNGVAGNTVALPVVMGANGNENTLAFSLNFDAARLAYAGVTLGSGAPGGVVMPNTSQTNSGRLGLAVSLPPNSTFAAGTQEVVEVSFALAVGTNATVTSVTFGDQPTPRQLLDPQINSLTATFTSGAISVAPASFEGDVFPRSNGDKAVTVTDWLLLGRYAARLDYPTNAAEFQRADCAPRSTRGDGAIKVTDWVQAGRYAFALDPVTTIGGPTNEIAGPGAGPSASRLVSVGGAVLVEGQTGIVGVNLAAQGNENALGLSLAFNPALVSFVGAGLGSGAAGASLYVNTNQVASGRLGLALALGAGSSFAAGTRELIKVTYRASASASGSFPASLTDQPVPREVSDAAANALPTSYVDGTVTISPPPSLRIFRSGQNVTLAWPLWASDFGLQAAGGVAPAPVVWTNLSVTATVSNNENVVALPVMGITRFYRLHRP